MPVTATLGALTYSKSLEDTTWKYWSLLTTGANLKNFTITSPTFDSTGNIFFGGASTQNTSTNEFYIAKINTSILNTEPTISFVDGNIRIGASQLGTIEGVSKFVETSANTMVCLGTIQRLNTIGTDRDTQTKFNIDMVSGNISNASGFEPVILNSSYGSNRDATDIVFDSTGNYTIIGQLFTYNVVSSVGYSNNQPYIVKYNSSGNVIFSKIFGSNANVDYSGLRSENTTFTINLDSANNYRIVCNHGIANTDPKSIIANVNSNFTSINWQKTLTDSNVLVMTDAVMVNNNSYVTLNDDQNSKSPLYIVKLDNTGNIIWDKKIDFTTPNSSYGFNSTVLYQNNNNLYIAGYTLPVPTGNIDNRLGLASLDLDTGNIIWQREIKFTSNTYTYTGTKVDLDIKDDNLLVGYTLSQVLTSNTANQSFQGALLSLPSDGAIPPIGTYDIGSNITLEYLISTEMTISTANLTINNSNCAILNPANSTYTNPLGLSKVTVSLGEDFSRLT